MGALIANQHWFTLSLLLTSIGFILMPLSRSFKSLQIRYVITATLLIGIGTYIMQAPPKSPYAFNQKHTLSGHITSLKESQSHYRNRTHYSLTFKTAKSSLLAYFSCKNCQLKLGDHITLSGLLVALPQKRNPGQFDWSSFYAKKGITGKLIKPKLIDHKPIKYNFKHRLETIRNNSINLFTQTFKAPYAMRLYALVFGTQGITLDETWQEQVQQLGLVHAIVVSGAQLSLLTGILWLLMQLMGLSPLWRWFLLSLVHLLFFIFVGAGAAMLRAVLMAHLIIALKQLKRDTSPLHILLVCLIIMALIEGFGLFSLGIWLSFSATFSLMVLVPYYSKRLLLFLPESARVFLLSSLLPTGFSSLILVIFRHTFYPLSFLANIIFLPIFESLVLLGVLFCALYSSISLLSSTLAYCISLPIVAMMSGLIYGVEALVELLTRLPFLEISVSQAMLAAFSLPAIATYIYFKKTRGFSPYRCILCSLIMGLLGLIICVNTPKPMRVTVFDVGQGDALLIRSPKNKTWLVDTGYGNLKASRFDYASSVIIPAMRYYGLQHLDGLILTHFDRDHIGSLSTLLKKVPIRSILSAANISEKALLKKLTTQQQSTTKLVYPKHLEVLTLDKVTTLRFFKNQNTHASKNNRSLMTHLNYKDFDMLLMGDAEKQQEKQLSSNLSYLQNIEILKVGHHGSKTSSSAPFLEAIKPLIATISAGQNNRYGHPHSSVLKRLTKNNSHIFRTDQAGAIHIISNGITIGAKGFLNTP